MANNTIYPYGTGGQMPSGIPIVNDLITGGANKALSAEQGVVLKGMTNSNVSIDLTVMGVILGVIVSNGNWSGSQTNHESIQVPVKPGQKYKMVANASQSSFYAFFTQVSFWVNGGTPSYSSSQSGRIELSANEDVEITIPSDTNYLYIALKNGGTNQEPQSLVLIEEKEEYIQNEVTVSSKRIVGSPIEFANYESDSFSFTGSSSQAKIEKVGENGYLLTNTTKATGKYFLYKLPEGLVDGEVYRIQFDYKSWLSASWALSAVDATGATQNQPVRALQVPASGEGHLSWDFTYLNGDAYLRLASNSQESGRCLLIQNLSVAKDNLSIGDISSRLLSTDRFMNAGTYLPYNGKRIDVDEGAYQYASFMTSVATHQSAACYGDYMVSFTDKMATIRLYNLKTKTLLATVSQSALDSLHHCNQSFFGNQFYQSGDAFPLVYITVNNNGSVAGGYLEAYRIVPTMGSTDYSSFTITLVQTITLPLMSDSNALGNANFAFDERSGFLYTYSRNNRSAADNYLRLRITKWSMPKLSQGNVVFSDNDILDSWETGTIAENNQGAAIKNHLLFIFRGGGGLGYVYVQVFDLTEKSTVAIIDLYKDGFTMEPEGVFFWGNTLCTTNTTIYRFFFK